MSEYIKREDALEELKEVVYRELASDPDNIRANTIIDAIEGIPAADVEPAVRGKWIEHDDECECPVCGETWNYCDNDTERFDCCPKCGARLVEHGKERER